MATGCGEKFVLRRRAGELDGATDASAGCGDLLIGGSGDALLELRRAIAGKDQVRMGIDKAGSDAAVLCIDNFRTYGDLALESAIATGSQDATVLDEKRRTLDEAQFAQLRALPRARRTGQRDKLADIDDSE